MLSLLTYWLINVYCVTNINYSLTNMQSYFLYKDITNQHQSTAQCRTKTYKLGGKDSRIANSNN